ncbi:MAG TPA: ABC transporter ATP-binding protein [Candidatus Ventricola gallistercoris]|nr:ABC transporter ATP-binding protein [Candidatus Ventricola gallistercoris]
MANVRFENVTVSYGNHTVLKNFSLEVESGQIMCLVGPSGCGKTTLVRALLGLNKPESGIISVGDRVLFDAKKRTNVPAEKRNIGIVFQDYAVWPHMTVIENVSYPLKKQRRNKQEIQQRAMHALEQVRMTEYANHLPSQLSGGQQQRVAIARALVTDSDVVVMDEPITNLDAKLREEMLLEIRMIQSRLHATILYITHDQQSALQLCDKMAIMQPDGSLCQYGTDEDIIMRPANRFTFEFIGVSNFIPLVQRGKEICLDCGEQIPFTQWVPAGVDVAGKEMGVRLNDVVFDRQSPIQATVTSRVFLGSEYNYFLTLGQREIRMQQSMLDARTFGTVSEGEKIGIRFLNPHFYDARKEAATV